MGQCPDRKPGPFTVANGVAQYKTETGITLSGQVSPNGQFEMRVVEGGGGAGPLRVMGVIDGNGKASVRQVENSCSYDFVWTAIGQLPLTISRFSKKDRPLSPSSSVNYDPDHPAELMSGGWPVGADKHNCERRGNQN